MNADDAAAVLDPLALAEVSELLGLCSGSAVDLAVAQASGCLHWCRYLSLGPNDGQQDLSAALRFLEPVFRAQPDAVPEQMLRYFEDQQPGASDDSGDAGISDADLMQLVRNARSHAEFDQAVDLLRQAAVARPSGHPGRIALLSELGLALSARATLTGSQADVDEAIRLGLDAVVATAADDPARSERQAKLNVALQLRFHQTILQADPAEADILSNRTAALRIWREQIDQQDQSGKAGEVAPPTGPSRGRARLKQIKRESLLAEVHRRLARFDTAWDRDSVLSEQALTVVGELFDTAADPATDLEVLQATGLVLWGRYLIAPSENRYELVTALRMLTPVYWDRYEAVPYLVRQYFDENPPVGLENFDQARVRTIQLLREGRTSGDPSVLDAAVKILWRVAATVPEDHPSRPGCVANLGVSLRIRFEATGVLGDLEEGIGLQRQAIDIASAGSPERAEMLYNLAESLRIRFEATGVLTDLGESLNLLRQAIAVTPPEHPNQVAYFEAVSRMVLFWFERPEAFPQMEQGIDLLRQAADTIPADDSSHREHLLLLSVVLRERSERTGALADLDAAIDVAQRLLTGTPASDPASPTILRALSAALQRRFERTGVPADLDAAIDAAQRAVTAEPAPVHLSLLSYALQRRFERTGLLADLDAAIDAAQQAVAAAPADDPELAVSLSALGVGLRRRFERTGVLADLDAAIDATQGAVTATPSDGAGLPMDLSNLGNALQDRFQRTGRLADLDEAIDAKRKSVELTPASDARRAGLRANLGTSLMDRFKRTGRLADLDEAVSAQRQAVDLTPVDDPRRVLRLSNLGAALLAGFKPAGDRAALHEAVTVFREAAEATPSGHADRARHLANLGAALVTRSRETGDLADLDEAIDAEREAADLTLADHPNRAAYLANLGTALRTRFERTGNPVDADLAIAAGMEAAACKAASPRARAGAARGWGHAAAAAGKWQEAVAAFEVAVEMIGRIAPPSLARDDQEYALADLAGLASEAAACCVRAGQASHAVELFEQGRGVLLGQVLDTRTDLTALAEQRLDLAERFASLQNDLDRADDHVESAETPSAGRPETAADNQTRDARLTAKRRQPITEALEEVIAQIRGVPGFAGFLRPLPAHDLAAVAQGGPVVIINVSRFGSHALILTSGGVLEPIPLDELTPDRVREQVAEFLTAVEETSASAALQLRLAAVLGWLWDEVTEPVLDRLGINHPPADDSWPRLWWCVSGLLSFLPLHAAGHHHTRLDAAPKTAIDRVISSYTPTIRALAYARRTRPENPSHPTGSTRDRIVVVAMPHTPGASDLRGAGSETQMLRRYFGERVFTIEGEAATHDAVLAALPGAQWAHFSCHGLSNPSDPSAGYLVLTDHLTRPLTVVDIGRLRLNDADLAFLSACSTARPSGRLADEAIHLTSAFQLAGYRHVIGTLWPIYDTYAVEFTEELYADLASATTIDPASSLHKATLRLRDRLDDEPSAWASHIHSGA